MTPGPALQKFNALVHKEPWSILAYGIGWTFFLFFIAPFASVLTLIPLTMYRLIAWKLDWNGAKAFDPKQPVNQQTEMAIFVTGCDSGFGKLIALWASNAGYVVFAGCLQEESIGYFHGKNLETSTNRIIPLIVDVTKDDDIAKAAKAVSSWLECADDKESKDKETESIPEQGKERMFHALVNNAGIAVWGLFDWMDESDIRRVMEVNYFGQVKCCKAFLPILKEQARKHPGSARILNVTSIAGLIPSGPIGWNYMASKHASQMLTEGLRHELGVFGIGVASINPGTHMTNILEVSKAQFQAQWDNISPEKRKEYGKESLEKISTRFATTMETLAFPIEIVADKVLDTLQCRDTPSQVLIGLDAHTAGMVLRLLPAWLTGSIDTFQLNLEPTNQPSSAAKVSSTTTTSKEH